MVNNVTGPLLNDTVGMAGARAESLLSAGELQVWPKDGGLSKHHGDARIASTRRTC